VTCCEHCHVQHVIISVEQPCWGAADRVLVAAGQQVLQSDILVCPLSDAYVLGVDRRGLLMTDWGVMAMTS
jgi:hypothetical protein